MLKSLILLLLLLISSCSLFRSKPPIIDKGLENILNALKMTGEGRGRFSHEKGQNVFSYEAVLRPEGDWLMAVAVPLHGEEVMVLRNIKENEVSEENADNFELRLEQEIDSRMKDGILTGKDYLKALRSLIRFALAPQLSLLRVCTKEKESHFQCKIDQDLFRVRIQKDKIFIARELNKTHFLELAGENLTDSFFSRTSFHLHSENRSQKSPSVFSLELFWK